MTEPISESPKPVRHGNATVDEDTLWIAWTAAGNPLKVDGKRLYGTRADWTEHTNMRAAEFEVFTLDPNREVGRFAPLWGLDHYAWPDRAATKPLGLTDRAVDVELPPTARPYAPAGTVDVELPEEDGPGHMEGQVIEVFYQDADDKGQSAYCPITPTEDASVALGYVTIADRHFVRTVNGDLIAVKRIVRVSGLTDGPPAT